MPKAQPAATAAPAAAPSPRVFAPQTYAQDRKPWTPPRPGAFARVPAWAIISGLAGLGMVVILIVIIGRHLGKAPPHGSGPETPATRGLVATQTGGATIYQTPGGGAGSAPALVPSPPTPTGRVYDGGTVQRSSDLYYIIVYSTPSQTAAQESANFLAQHGVNVSIERVSVASDARNPIWHMLVSVEGFRTNTLAQPTLKKIQQIGNQMSPNAWKDAHASNGLTSPGAPTSRASATTPARGGTR